MKENVYNILKGKFLISDDAFKNWRIIIFILVLALIMIASSHSVDKKVHKIARITNETKELRSQMIAKRGQLMRLKKETYIEQIMLKKGLEISKTPPQKIIVKTNKN